ncbi:peptide ABC transporter substrate-binding protein [Marinithermofilum abyssi]|uniref:Peptide ABC transporter substrate-binding protein n=1 Tax=Marinithermofilum abyssi TaxID=1571185 RepID=A0A8J2VBK7_9BACL|nr:peptide ABC transporter substrate-binding protein [Marinithermofilum abyssi]GGE06979.1 peptide ABC transporter substrate-binding protein [Marinithermofilum abyssi]
MRRRLHLVLTLLLATSMLLTACGVSGGGNGDSGMDAKQVLDMTLEAEPPNLDSVNATDVVSVTVLNNVMEGLYRMDKDNRPEPAIASSVDVSKDKKTYIFHLRDANWSDGKPVRAQDFEFAWKRGLAPETKSEYAFIFFPILNAEEYNHGKATADQVGVKALDDKTLKVQLKQPIPYFLNLTAFPTYLPQREDIVEKFGKAYATEPDKMVYNGPFNIQDWQHEQSMQYRKSDTYWDRSAVNLEKVNLKIVKDTSTAVNLYNSKQTDVAKLDSAFADAFKQSPEFMPVQVARTEYVQFNTDNPFFANEKIRKAISYAIDRDSLVKDVLKDGSESAYALVPPSIIGSDNKPFRDKAPDQHQFNPLEAKKLLKEGMEEQGITEKPTLTLLTFDDERKKVAVFIQEQLRNHLGIEVRIDPQPYKQKLDRESSGDFDITYAGWTSDFNDPISFLDLFTSSSPFNRGNWQNPNFDQLVSKSKNNVDYDERNNELVKAESILVEKAPIAPVIYVGKAFLQKKYVKDLYRHPVGPEYSLKWTYVSGKSGNKDQ